MRLKYLLPILLAAGLSTAALANPYETTLNNGQALCPACNLKKGFR